MGTEDLGTRWHLTQLGTIDKEIARLAAICEVKMLDPGVIERVMANDETVCGKKNEKAFRKLRTLVGMHYALANDSIQSLGPEASAKILEEIRANLGKRYDIGGGR